MRRPVLLLLASILLGGAARGSCEEGPGQTEWKTTTSPHFLVYHEAPFAPPGVVLGLEKLYGRLRLDLSMFAPWMEKEKVKVYIYRTRNTYLNPKEFNPPSWSDGIAFLDRKVIVSFEQKGRRKLTEILAHEMTHLLFESYWQDARRDPPTWINEGLSMLEETPPAEATESDWYQAMGQLGGKAQPFTEFVKQSPMKHMKERDQVARWYVQAYSMVHFLYRKHSRMQFFNFCSHLSKGRDLQQALWMAYRYPSLDKFEGAWRRWMNMPEMREKLRPRVSASAPPGGEESAEPRQGMTKVRYLNFNPAELTGR